MPFYEYKCTTCDFPIEVYQNINDPPLTLCYMCIEGVLEKIITSTDFKLKGTGWDKTDYKE